MTLADAFPATRPAVAIRSWAEVPAAVERAEIHGRAVKDFGPLEGLAKLRTLEVSAPSPAQLAVIGRLDRLEVLGVDHLGDELDAIGRLRHLQALKLFAFEGASLAGIEGLTGLLYLQIEHAPKLASLAPLGSLTGLEWLSILTPPSWDASRKTITVDTLAPLSGLRALRFLRLMGVEPQADALAPLGDLKELEELAISHVYNLTLADHAGLAAALPNTEGDCLKPSYRLAVRAICKKCRESEQVWLTAPPPRAKRALCPNCDAPKLAAHEAEFERLKALALTRPAG